WIYQQDSAPSHSSKTTQEYLSQRAQFITSTEWPSCSPDLNPLDYCIWALLKHNVYSHKIQNFEELKNIISSEWEKLDISVVNKSILSWRKR
ncbi:Protein CBG27381-like protein, partial [Dinothrombium tinctorium]